MKYMLTMLALILGALNVQARTVNVFWELIQPKTLRLVKVTSPASPRDVVKTYLGGVLYATHDNGLHKTENMSGENPIGFTQWQSCTGCGDGGGGGKHLNGPALEYEYYYNASGELTGAYAYESGTNKLVRAELYAGGMLVSTYSFQTDGSLAPMGEDYGTYTVVTTDINNDGVVVIQKYGITIPFGHVIMSFQKVGTYGRWEPSGSTHTQSGGSGGSSGSNILYKQDVDLDEKDH